MTDKDDKLHIIEYLVVPGQETVMWVDDKQIHPNAVGPSPSNRHPCQDGLKPHCWHATNMSYTTDPPMPITRCCNCGETKAERTERPKPDPRHGPFQ